MFEQLAQAAAAVLRDNENKPALPLSSTELTVLAECEALIREGNKTVVDVFVDQGRAFQRILKSRLYRGKHRTFDAYCQDELDMSARHARRLMAAADAYGELEDWKFFQLPNSESQVRPLLELRREEWVPAWEEVVGTAPGGKVTAKHVEAVVERRTGRLNSTRAKAQTVQSPKSGVQSPEPTMEPGEVMEVEHTRAALAVILRPQLSILLESSQADGIVIDAEEVTSRGKQIRELARQVQRALRRLHDTIGAGGGLEGTTVINAIRAMDELESKLSLKERLFQEQERKAENPQERTGVTKV